MQSRLNQRSLRTGSAASCLALWTVFCASGLLAQEMVGDPATGQNAADRPGTRYVHWLEDVAPLILDHEVALFESLEENYQREAFVREFWRIRDPYPETGRNELRERYMERLAFAEGAFPSLDDARARILLIHGEPSSVLEVRCTRTRKPAIVWAYQGSDTVRFEFVLLFLRGNNGLGPARIWRPSKPGAIDSVIRHARSCINGGLVEQVVQQLTEKGGDYESLLDRVLLKPRPRSLEWVEAFRADSPRLPAGAMLFPVEEETQFVGRVQSRTATQWFMTVDRDRVEVGEFAGYRSFDFELIGEVIRGGDLLETFRYKFGISEEEAEAGLLPLVFQRHLRPGDYRVVLRLEDLNGGKFYRSDRELSVPAFLGEPLAEDTNVSSSAGLFTEATAALAADEVSIRIMQPDGLQRGAVRFDTLASGAAIRRVRFLLDGKAIATKTRPPFNVEVDLGPFPRQRTVQVEALDEGNRVIARDQLEVNAGGKRFSVRIDSPRGTESNVSSVVGTARVNVPETSSLESVEYFVNERRATTLYQEPWTQPLQIPHPSRPSFVRVVARLTDGTTAEDLVFVNGGRQVGERVDIQVVEVYTSALDRFSQPISGVGREDVRVFEGGVQQEINRFELVKDLPFHVGIVIDNSASMRNALETAKRAALRFLERAVGDVDRAAVITFNSVPHLAVPMTNDARVLGAGLAGLTPEGQTALYDSVMFSLYYFTGIPGQRAILLLTDGRDEVSRFGFAETLEYARRAGVTIYTVGLLLPEGGANRSQLKALASETGGESYFIRDVDDLVGIYEDIEHDLRSQYLVTYQSENTSSDEAFRTIEIKIKGASTVKAMSGYYP